MVLCNLTADSLDTVGNLLTWLLASPNLLGWPTSLGLCFFSCEGAETGLCFQFLLVYLSVFLWQLIEGNGGGPWPPCLTTYRRNSACPHCTACPWYLRVGGHRVSGL